MNVHESEKIAGQLENLGYSKIDDATKADIVVFNTCTIRENAVHKAYGNIGRLKTFKQENKNVIFAVGGCMTQDKEQAEDLKKKLPFIDIIFGTHNLTEFGDMVKDFLKSKKKVFEVWENEKEMPKENEVTRNSFPNAFVNIMYGCNNFCTYCIVPYVRGRERSRNMEEIVNEVTKLLEDGYREITLLGQNVNSYGNDLDDNDSNFVNLMEVLAQLPFKYRLRFMTSHPKDFKEELAVVIGKYDNIPNYIHLPIQSGSNNVLEKMNRKYTREDYLKTVELIKKHVPNYALSSDLMVGFPQETEEDFLETMSLAETIRYSQAFTFVYSVRHGTVAGDMEGHIDEDTKSNRIQRLVALQNNISKEISDEYIGNIYEILVEESKVGAMCGRTETGRLVKFPTENYELLGKFVNVKITSTTISGLKGEFVEINE